MCKPSDVGIVSKVTMSSMKGGEGYSHSAGPASTSSSVEHKPFIRSGGGGGGASDRTDTTSLHVCHGTGCNATTASALRPPTPFSPAAIQGPEQVGAGASGGLGL